MERDEEETNNNVEEINELESLEIDLENCFSFVHVRTYEFPFDKKEFNLNNQCVNIITAMLSPDGDRIFLFKYLKQCSDKNTVEIYNRNFEGLFKITLSNYQIWDRSFSTYSRIDHKCLILDKDFLLFGTRIRILVDLRKIEEYLKIEKVKKLVLMRLYLMIFYIGLMTFL